MAAPEVDDRAPVPVHGESRSHLGAGLEALRERGPDALEPDLALTVNDRAPGQRGSLLFSSVSCSLMNARMSPAMSSSLAHCSL